MNTNVVIVGSGVSGLYCALNISADKNIIVVSKDTLDRNDSYLAQGGICVLKNEDDYDSFFEDTLRAGHYENRRESVDIMIRSSLDAINDLVGFGVKFEMDGEDFAYTKEGAHSHKRILYHEDETGKEITSKLLKEAKKRKNISFLENFCMVDILEKDNECAGIAGFDAQGRLVMIQADYTVLATGGIGGLYEHSTNYRHLTGDSLAIALKHGIRLKNIDYIQIHPTTLYTKKEGRKFLISESVRGEGGILLDKNKKRFTDELQPRDVVAKAIYKQMEKDKTPHVWLSMENISEECIKKHFPNIYARCLKEGYDVTKECIPVVPAQHYFMGGIDVDKYSMTSCKRLYAVGETACNGVHGKNRLASNSLLESIVFAKRAAKHLCENYQELTTAHAWSVEPEAYENYQEKYKKMILEEIEKEKNSHE